MVLFLQIRLPGQQESIVCQQTFAALHGVSLSRVRRLAEAKLVSICSPLDMRGKQANPHRVQDSVKKQIEEHIRSFPVMRSHYSRSHHGKKRRYLSPLLTVADMHDLYVAKYESNGEGIVSYDYYRKYFNENFNISFGNPKADTCGTCDQLKHQIEAATEDARAVLLCQKEEHLREAENFYSSLRTNTILAKQNSHIATITFDFQQNLPLPHIPVGEVFYSHQLWLYVFGVHDCSNNQATMFCWPETVASKGSDEVISCLDYYLRTLPQEVTTLYLYSDGCPGQNKNVNVLRYLFSLVQLGRFNHIQHNFPVRGHSFLPNDRDFGHTESKKRKVENVYIPDQWFDVIKRARKRNPFSIVSVTQNMVMKYSDHLLSFFKKTVSVNKKAFSIQRSRVLDYSSDHPEELWVKYSTQDETWTKYKILRGKQINITLPTEFKYHAPLPLKPSKVEDINNLVKKYVPTEYQVFYSLISTDEHASSETDESETD